MLKQSDLIALRFMTITVSQPFVSSLEGSSYFASDISIDGDTAIAFTEDVEARFAAYDWQVLHVDDGDQYVEHSPLWTSN